MRPVLKSAKVLLQPMSFQCFKHLSNNIPTSTQVDTHSDISKFFGSDSTSQGIGFQFRQIKNDAKRQRACVAAGSDPASLSLTGGADNSGPIQPFSYYFPKHKTIDYCFVRTIINRFTATAQYFPAATPYALDHFFRPIKKEALKLRAEGPSAGTLSTSPPNFFLSSIHYLLLTHI